MYALCVEVQCGDKQQRIKLAERPRLRLMLFALSTCCKGALAQRLDRRGLDRLRETCTMLEVVGPNQRDRAFSITPKEIG